MKNIKIHKIGKKHSSIGKFYQKISLFAIVLTFGFIFISGSEIKFLTDITELSKGLLKQDILEEKIEFIKDNKAQWPLKLVTNRGSVDNYQQIKWTKWNDLDEDLKTPFPEKFTNIMEEYKYITPYDIWDYISNPEERKKVLFYKRLMTTTWATAYCYSATNCKSWIEDSGTHAGIDFVSSIGTPLYAIMNGVVIKACNSGCDGFGNQLVVATDFGGEIYATFYGHMNNHLESLKEGDIIKRGDLIGYVGNTGISSAPHLHLQINKLGKTSDIKDIDYAKQLYAFDGSRNQTVALVKQTTINPLSFIEKFYTGGAVNDAFQPVDKTPVEDSAPDISTPIVVPDEIEDNQEDTTNDRPLSADIIADAIADNSDNNSMHGSAGEETPNDFAIEKITLSDIDNRLTIGDNLTATIKTSGSKGAISLTVNNNVLKPVDYIINPVEGKDEYKVVIKANEIGNAKLIFNDGENNKTYYYGVYAKPTDVYGLAIEGPGTVIKNSPSKFVFFAIDKLGNKIDTSLDGSFKLTLKNKTTGEKQTLEEFIISDKKSFIEREITVDGSDDYQLKVIYTKNNKTLIATKNLETDIFLDYSTDHEFGKAIKYLNDNNIVSGFQGKLMPDQLITRGQIITILMRHRHGDNKEVFRSEMNQYMAKNGRFFTDISGAGDLDPYIYKAFKDGVLKGAAGKALSHDNVTKAELITIYGRFFNVSRKELFTAWMDVKNSDWYKEFADAAKKYNLYPFEDLVMFNAENTVTRLNAFESLHRYITVKIPVEATSNSVVSTPSTNTNVMSSGNGDSNSIDSSSNGGSTNTELEDLMKKLLGN